MSDTSTPSEPVFEVDELIDDATVVEGSFIDDGLTQTKDGVAL